ncbi:hypothetical protein [Pseudoduganella umbonata]|nr:hypothetical protein [Pseudoduganella umbonata]QCP09919.1 hypothetical protein FCL38_05390 [Pseudoduganella umbonata]
MITAHPDAVAAAILIYMVDTGANVSVALSLTVDSEQPTDHKDFVRFESQKARAGYSEIVKELPVNDAKHDLSSVKVLRNIREMTHHARAGIEHAQGQLFVFAYFEEPSIASQGFVAKRLRYFLRDEGLRNLGSRPSAIRVSFLLKHTIEGDGNIAVTQALADHSSGGTTETYALRWPVRAKYVKLIRHFQDNMAQQVFSAPESPESSFGRVGIEAVVSARTGVGVNCIDPKAGYMDRERVGRDCAQVGQCWRCEGHIVVVDLLNLTDAIIVNATLKSKATEMEANNALKWEEYYLPLLAFTDVLIEKAGRSKFSSLLRKARDLASRQMQAGTIFSL